MWSVVHQFVPTLHLGDAIGDHVVRIQARQRARGRVSEIFVDVERDETAHLTHPMTELDDRIDKGSTLLMYHVAQASRCAEFLLNRPEPLALQFHNFTPVDLLVGWDASAACDMLEAGRQLRDLASVATIGISDSHHNAEVLTDHGVEHSRVAIIPVQVSHETVPRLVTQTAPSQTAPSQIVLFVGRVAPNKAFHDLIACAAVLRHSIPNVQFRLVGGETSETYSRALRQLTRSLDLESTVTFTGRVSDKDLAADIFCSLSDHEGFGVPLLEAMARALPVVAFDSSAVGETVGYGGLILTDKSPTTVAAALERVLTDPALAEHLSSAGLARAASFTAERSDTEFETAFAEAWGLFQGSAPSTGAPA
jgi:glycosyltransferase involved in cell wall biosynthesis